jgi:hypothetical protein
MTRDSLIDRLNSLGNRNETSQSAARDRDAREKDDTTTHVGNDGRPNDMARSQAPAGEPGLPGRPPGVPGHTPDPAPGERAPDAQPHQTSARPSNSRNGVRGAVARRDASQARSPPSARRKAPPTGGDRSRDLPTDNLGQRRTRSRRERGSAGEGSSESSSQETLSDRVEQWFSNSILGGLDLL